MAKERIAIDAHEACNIGEFHSTGAGYGILLSASGDTKALDICADDGGAALTSSTRTTRSRLLITAAITGNVSAGGLQAQVKINANVTTTGCIYGSWNYIEIVAGKTVGSWVTACRGMVELPATAVIASGGVLSAFEAYSLDLGGTHTGVAAPIHVPNPAAGTWDYFAVFGSATGVCTSNTHSIDGHACVAIIPVLFNATPGYIPVLAAVPS